MQFEPTLSAALNDYQVWLTTNSIQNSCGATTPTGAKTVSMTGKVLRISSVQTGTSPTYYIQIAGQHVIFTASLSLSPKLPLVQAGDTVTVTYLSVPNSTSTTVQLKTFDDTSINLGPSPITTPTASATP